ncbi:M20 family metallopeptidase [Haloparvum sp. PAK95]|uniref:M20 family metallopeptidase n=1 Tax=Haloparvum sp. PAK95 TaxID=3418962 RepID=UPI003D2EC5DC
MTFDLDEFHRRAVQIPSHEDVAEMRDLVVETLQNEGHEPEIDETGNIVAVRGTTGNTGTHLVLNTHIDTVPPHQPFERDGDIVRGRGACDAKGPLAAMLDAFLSASIGDGQLTLAITPNEETSQLGGAHLGDELSADGYIVGEPTGLDVCPAARGNFGGYVTIYGESAHASEPNSGTNPLRAIGALIEALEAYDTQCGPGEHELLGKSTLAPTRVEGGGPLNQIPSECTVSFDRRTVPPETIDDFVASLEAYLDQRLPGEVDYEVGAAYPDSPSPDAFATELQSELVQTLATVSGGEIRPFEAATEASYFADDAPTVVFGPGVLADEEGPVAHSNREYISLSAIADAASDLSETLEILM